MSIFTFTGRILPDAMAVSLSYQPKFSIAAAETIDDTIFKLSLSESRLTVTADTVVQTGDFKGLFFYAYDLARSVCDVLTTTDGVVHVPVLETVELPDGRQEPVILADRRLGGILSVYEGYGFEAVLELVATDIGIARLMADITSMLTWTHYAPIAAGRAAESIRLLLTGGRTKADWARMQELLNVDRAYLQLLTDHSAPPRHGDRQYVDATTNGTLAARAWTLTDRFLAYRLGGSQPLDIERYPLLVG